MVLVAIDMVGIDGQRRLVGVHVQVGIEVLVCERPFQIVVVVDSPGHVGDGRRCGLERNGEYRVGNGSHHSYIITFFVLNVALVHFQTEFIV